MLNLNRQSIDKIKKALLRQEKKIKQELKEIDKDDPVFDGGLAESIEPGTSSWMADVHSRAVALKDNLSQLLKKIQRSQEKIKKGTYGICEVCGKAIEKERLLAMPTATLCIKDSKKTNR